MNEGATSSRSEQSSLLSSATEDEILVAQILLDLSGIIMADESRSGFEWGNRRRRSRMDDEGAPSSVAGGEIGEKKSAAKAASPVTPLCFAPSESDEKKSRRAFSKSCRKRTKEEYSDLIEELTQRRDLLRGEIEKVTKYFKKLKAHNSELKAMKQEVLKTSSLIRKEPEMEKSPEVNHGLETTQSHQFDRTAEKFQHPSGPLAAQFNSVYNGLGSVHLVGPIGVPYLNISAVNQSEPLDAGRALADRRARFAEARRLRKGIIKIKAMRKACGITLPGTR